jgi:fluoroquinolone transport system permease protein
VTRLASALRLELTLQVRQRFLQAAVFSGLIWLAVLLPLSGAVCDRSPSHTFCSAIHASSGFFFVAGAVFFESRNAPSARSSRRRCGSGSI